MKICKRIDIRIIGGFIILFIAAWVINLIFGVGINMIMRNFEATENIRVFIGSTLSYGGRAVAVVFFSAYMIQKVLGIDPWSTMFPKNNYWWKDLAYGFFIVTLIMFSLFIIEVALGWLQVEGWNWKRMSLDAWLRNVWLAMLINIYVAVGEESIFRGYLLTGLNNIWGEKIGLLIMASLFALPHMIVTGAEKTNGIFFVVMLSLPGFLLGWSYLKSNSLWLPIGIHFAWNIVQDDILNLNGRDVPSLIGAITHQKGPEWIVGTSYGIEVGLLGIIAVILVGFGIWIWINQENKRPVVLNHIFKRER